MEGKIIGVTVHNTDWISVASGTTPAEQYTRATVNGNMKDVRVHYYVDNTCAWQNLPHSLSGWHAADGSGKEDIYLTDLEGEKFICLNDSWSLQKMIKEQCDARGIQLSTSIQVDNPDILRRLLCQNLGITFVPEKTWGVDFAKGMLELRNITDFSIKRYAYVDWKAGYLPQNTKKCIALIKAFFQKL